MHNYLFGADLWHVEFRTIKLYQITDIWVYNLYDMSIKVHQHQDHDSFHCWMHLHTHFVASAVVVPLNCNFHYWCIHFHPKASVTLVNLFYPHHLYNVAGQCQCFHLAASLSTSIVDNKSNCRLHIVLFHLLFHHLN